METISGTERVSYQVVYSALEILAHESPISTDRFSRRLAGACGLDEGKKARKKVYTRLMKYFDFCGVSYAECSSGLDQNDSVDTIGLTERLSNAMGKLDLAYGIDSIERRNYLRREIQKIDEHNSMHPDNPISLKLDLLFYYSAKGTIDREVFSTASGLIEAIFGDFTKWKRKEIKDYIGVITNGGPVQYGIEPFLQKYFPAENPNKTAKLFYHAARKHARSILSLTWDYKSLTECRIERIIAEEDTISKKISEAAARKKYEMLHMQ